MGTKKEIYEDQAKLSAVLVAWRIPGFVAAVLAAAASDSIVVWMEVVESFSIIIPGILLFYISFHLRKDLKYKFNYGTAKVEAIAAVICEAFDVVGLTCVSFIAIKELVHPEHESKFILEAFGLLLLGMIIDIFLLMKQKKLAETMENRMLHTAYLSSQKEFCFDLISLVTLLLCYIFRNFRGIVYFSPVVCLIVGIPFIYIVSRHLLNAIMELSDVTLDEEYQLKILKMLSEFYEEYESIGDVRSRRNGDHLLVEIEISFADDRTYGEIKEVSAKIEKRLEELLGKCKTDIIVY